MELILKKLHWSNFIKGKELGLSDMQLAIGE